MFKRIDRFAARFASRLCAPSFRSSDPIAVGDRLAAAKGIWSEDEFPTLYRYIPADIRRPVVWDGRILGGREVGWLSWQHLTPTIVEDAVRTSGYTALRVSIATSAIVLVLWFLSYLPPGTINLGLLTTLVSSDLPFLAKTAAFVSFAVTAGLLGIGLNFAYRFLGGRSPRSLQYSILAAVALSYGGATIGGMLASFAAGQIPGFDIGAFSVAASKAVQTRDLDSVWLLPSPRWMVDAGEWLLLGQYIVAQVALLLTKIPIFVGLVVAMAVFFLILFPTLWTFGAIRSLRRWSDETGAPYTRATRDALLVWKAKADGTRDAEYRAYCRQVDDASGRLVDLPLIGVGTATGVLRARGDMRAPVRSQLVAFDGESVRSHTLVLGDTGSGKTRDVLRPLFGRLMSAAWGHGHRLGAYVTDGKGTLWRDLLPLVAHRDDVLVIGTEDGQCGVDLLHGMTPLEVSSTFKAVAAQVAGKPSDDFWTESASLLVMHAATVAEALHYDRDHGLPAFGEFRPYSLAGVAAVAVGADLTKAAAERIMALSKAEPGQISDVLYNAVSVAIQSASWLLTTYLPMAQETRSSVTANVNVVLGKLSGTGRLAQRFAYGLDDADMADVDHALRGGILMVAIGDTEYGLAGRVISTWLKQRFYVLAKRRLVTDPAACRNTTVAMVADEFQMLVTAGPDSDTTFWNVARETGVFMLAATQSVAALKQAIGSDQTANLLNLLRNKIVLSTGEVETIDYIRKLAGDLPMGWEPDEGFYSTQATREMAEPGLAAQVKSWFPLPVFPKLDDPSMSEPVELDERFDFGRRVSSESRASSLQSAYWRREDKSKEALTSGLSWMPKIRHDELRQGQGFAFAMIYRGGLDRADIIDLRSI